MITSLLIDGEMTGTEIAKMFNVSKQLISGIKCGKKRITG
jgi:phage portal protein BeeE